MPPASVASAAVSITSHLLDAATRSRGLGETLTSLAARLQEVGVPVRRMRTSVTTKHPELFVLAVMWHAERGTEVRDGKRELLSTPTFLESPVAEVRAGAPRIRCRLTGPDADLSYAIARELAADGLTDYVVHPLIFGTGERTYFSFATDAPEGFSDDHLALFEALLPVLSVRVELESTGYALSSLLQVYLGHNAASRVLEGAFLRGTGQPIHAAVWFCDMRGFTTLADRLPAAEVVTILDRFFESVAGPIAPHGGEVLKFIGDAVLAIFPVQADGAGAACERALAAAHAAVAGVAAQNAAGTTPTVDLGIGLHVGEVMYGNIGAPNRLDFTVIGAVVNEVCRVESLCRALASPILMTSAFAALCDRGRVESRGVHALKGVSAPQEIFAPAARASSAAGAEPRVG